MAWREQTGQLAFWPAIASIVSAPVRRSPDMDRPYSSTRSTILASDADRQTHRDALAVLSLRFVVIVLLRRQYICASIGRSVRSSHSMVHNDGIIRASTPVHRATHVSGHIRGRRPHYARCGLHDQRLVGPETGPGRWYVLE